MCPAERLAPDPAQAAATAMARHRHDPLELLQVLREVQEDCGWIPPEAIDCIQARLTLPRSKILGVATFYSFLHLKPCGRYRILFSDNITDRMLGSPALLERLCRNLWAERGKVTEDGLVSVDTTSCTGLCDQGPALLVNGRAITRLTERRVDELCDLVRGEVPLDAWPADFFRVEDNIHRRDVLLGTSWAPGRRPRGGARAGPRGARRGDEGLAAARPRRRRVPRRAQVAGLPRRAGQGALRRLQRRRGRAGQLQGPRAARHRRRRGDRGHDARAPSPRARGGASSTCAASTASCSSTSRRCWRAGAARGCWASRSSGATGSTSTCAIHVGAGAYVCGEESALIESLEGKRGTPRNRPPYPVTHGYLGEPTVVNNVETLAASCLVALKGGAWYAGLGTAESTGTKLLCVSGDCERPGIYEYPFGVGDPPGARRLRRAAHAGGAGERAVGRLRARGRVRPAPRLRGPAHGRRPHGVRRAARHVRGGAQLRALLRARELRLLHAVPRRHLAPRQHDGQARQRARLALRLRRDRDA